MSKEILIVNTWLYHDLPKAAKHLSKGEHILFGGKLCVVVDAEFSPEVKYPNDLSVTLVTITRSDDGKLDKVEQRVVLSRDFEVQPISIVLNAKDSEVESDAAEANAS